MKVRSAVSMPRRPTANVWPSGRLMAGRMVSRRSSSDAAWASSSAHSGTRSPVSVSTSTTVEASVMEAPMSVHFGRLEASASMPGKKASRGVLGLNPSLRFHSVRSMTVPSTLAPRAPAGIETRSPVSEVGSCWVYELLGKGSRQ
ncbi:MAG: hypothetical protein IPP16_03240 [Acidimicrobiaceae bacterium]|nr:hypothetical protein [Acidimicrobiaceae bacterium]